jgi:hypothetical protein
VKEGKDKIAKQQKVITVRWTPVLGLDGCELLTAMGIQELERKNHVLTDRLDESKLSIEALTGR